MVIIKIYLIFIIFMFVGMAGGEVLHVTQTPAQVIIGNIKI